MLTINKPKKVLCALAIATAINGVAFANEIEFSGDINVLVGHEKSYKGSDKADYTETTARIMAELKLSDEWKAFARYGYRNFGGDDDGDTISKLDQFGFTYSKGETTTVKLGVQDTIMGPFGAVIDLTDNIGDNMLKGVDITHQANDVKYHFIGGKLDKNIFGDDDKSIHGLEVSKEFGKFNVGGELVKIKDTPDASDRYYGVYASTSVGKADFNAEYLRSNADSAKSGYLLGVSHKASDKDTFGITYRDIKENAVSAWGEDLAGYAGQGTEITWERSVGKGAMTLTYDAVSSAANTIELEYNIAF